MREIQIISVLWEVTQTRQTPTFVMKPSIIFQCVQIRKLELVKIIRLSWSTCAYLTERRLKNSLCMI